MDLHRRVGLPGLPFSHQNIVDQHFHHLSCEMLQVGVALYQFPTVVSCGDAGFQLLQMLPKLLQAVLQLGLFPGKILR